MGDNLTPDLTLKTSHIFSHPSSQTPLKSGPLARKSGPKQRKWREEALKYMQLMSSHHSIGVYMLRSA